MDILLFVVIFGVNKMEPFSINIFVPSGNPHRLRVATKSASKISILIFSKFAIRDAKVRAEWKLPGVYVLFSGDSLYIGEGDVVGPRLEEHARKRDDWLQALIFTAGSGLNKSHIQYIEGRLIRLGQETNQFRVDNQVLPTDPTMSEHDEAFARAMLSELVSMLSPLGFWGFDIGDSWNNLIVGKDELKAGVVDCNKVPSGLEFNLNSEGVTARLKVLENMPTVLQGSHAEAQPPVWSEIVNPSLFCLRRTLLDAEILTMGKSGHLEFTKNYCFESAKMAASVILGLDSDENVWVEKSGKSIIDSIL